LKRHSPYLRTERSEGHSRFRTSDGKAAIDEIARGER
jgi:hypothetical protein